MKIFSHWCYRHLGKRVVACGLGLFSFLSSASLFAQDEVSVSKFRFGIKGGGAVSYFTSEQPHTGVNLGFTVGALGIYNFSETFGVQAELNYLQQGGALTKFRDDSRFGSEPNFFTANVKTSKVFLHNVEIPVLCRISPFSGSSVKPFVYLGPSVALNLHATESYNKTGQLEDQSFVTVSGKEAVSDYEFLQIGASAGMGLEVPMGEKSLLVDVRYRYDITPAKKSYSYIDLWSVKSDIRTNTVSFTIGLLF